MTEKTERPSFETFFTLYGDWLYQGYTEAKKDGNDERFTQWVQGEYHVFLRDKQDYEVPYVGMKIHGNFD